MKALHNLRHGVMLFSLLCAGVLSTQAQSCDYAISAAVKHSDCNQNGQITITLSGPAIITAGPGDKQYRVFPAGTSDANKPQWSTTDVWSNLTPGVYTVETRVFCRGGGSEYVWVDQSSSNHVINQSISWAQANFVILSPRKSMSCALTGVIKVENIIGSGKGPYSFEIVSAPAAYTALGHTLPETIYTKQGNGLPSAQTFNGFPAGAYQIRFTDGCGGQVTKNIAVEQLSTDFYSNMFDPYVYTPTYISASLPTDKHLLFRKRSSVSSTDDFYEYFTNWHLYYDIAFILPSESPATLPPDRWQAIPSGATYFLYESPSYTLTEMRADKSNKQPIPVLRVKNSACTSNYPRDWRANYIYITKETGNCAGNKIKIGPTDSGERSIYAYPVSWKITAGATPGGALIEQSAGATLDKYNTVVYPTTLFSPGTYLVTYTDALGYEELQSFTVNASTNDLSVNRADIHSFQLSYPYSPSCNWFDVGYPYIYKSSSGSTPTAKVTVTYIGASSSGSTTAGAEDMNYTISGQVPNPPLPTFTTPANYTGYIYLYNEVPWSGSTMNYLSSKTEWPYNVYLHFNVTDSCNNTKRMVISKNSPMREYYYNLEPKDEILKKNVCGIVELTMPNIDNLMKFRYYSNGFGAPHIGNTNANFRIKPGTGNIPAGAQVTYSNPNGYCRSATDKIFVTTPGKYVIQTVWEYQSGNNSGYINDSYCLREDTIEVVMLPFQMDRNTSAAYHCPTPDGQGFSTSGQISIVPINGSGNYRYELFRKSDTNTPIDMIEGNETEGVFSNNNGHGGWAADINIDTLVVKVTDLTCLRSFIEKIAVYDLNNTSVLWTIGSPRKCVGDNLYLRSLALGTGTSYTWRIPDGQTYSIVDMTISNLTVTQGGWYRLEITVAGCPGVTKKDSIKISVADKRMYWNPAAADNNWHNDNNWLLKGSGTSYTTSVSVPAPCTTVHIAGNAQHYPSLDAEGTPRTIGTEFVGAPACDTIYYHYGSETAYPHYLHYNRAKVQYNFRYYTLDPDGTNTGGFNGGTPQPGTGNSRDAQTSSPFYYPNVGGGITPAALPSMNRNRWYMVSLPLKHITGGDFNLAGKPFTYQRLYNASSPMTGYAYRDNFTREFHSLAEDGSNHAYGLAILAADNYDALGWRNHYNFQDAAIRGVIELPFYMDNNRTLMDAHLQTYDTGTGTSSFQYFKWKDDGQAPAPLSPMGIYDAKDRDYKGYRFIFENAQDTVATEKYPDSNGPLTAIYDLPLGEILSSGTANRVMVGNPLMCHIDFAKIYAANSDVIENFFYIFNGETEAFEQYSAGDIAPLQGFVLVVKPARTRDSLKLPLEGQYAVVSQHGWNYGGSGPKTPLPKPRSAAAQNDGNGRIDIIAATPMPAELAGVASTDSIRITTNILFGDEGAGNIPKITFPKGMENKAEVFIVSPDGTQISASQTVNDRSKSLRIGLESGYEKEIMLTFRFYGAPVKSATLIDKFTGRQTVVTDGSVYRFTHRYDRSEGGFRGLDSERFELWPDYTSSDGMDAGSYYFTASLRDGELLVMSSETLAQVEVVNAAGVVIHKATGINSGSYVHTLNITAGVYLLKATLSDGRTEVRKLMEN